MRVRRFAHRHCRFGGASAEHRKRMGKQIERRRRPRQQRQNQDEAKTAGMWMEQMSHAISIVLWRACHNSHL